MKIHHWCKTFITSACQKIKNNYWKKMLYQVPLLFFNGTFVSFIQSSTKIVGTASRWSKRLFNLDDLKHVGSKWNEHILPNGKTSSSVNPHRLSQICRLSGRDGNLIQNKIKLIILTSSFPHTLGQLKYNTYECKDMLELVYFAWYFFGDLLHTTQLLPSFDNFSVMIILVFLVSCNYAIT